MANVRALTKLAAAIDYDQLRAAKLIALLNHDMNKVFLPLALTGIALDGREYLAYQALGDLGLIITNTDNNSYTVNSNKIDSLIIQLEIIIELNQLHEETPIQFPQPFLDLAWTLPDKFENRFDLPHRSLAGLLKFTISQSKRTLFLISPFLEKSGLQILEGPILGACNRGVKIVLISHGLDDKSSPNYTGYNYFKSIVPNLTTYSSPFSQNTNPYFLIHAKIIVADDDLAVVSSANLTQYGLGSHLELGVGLTGEPASQLYKLTQQIIESQLVQPIN